MQRYFSNKKNDNSLILSSNDIYHIRTVMRMSDNTHIEVVYNKELYICSINSNNEAEILEKKKSEDIKLNVTLIIPVLKEAKMDYILQKATELGVDEIIPVNTERTIVKLDSKKEEKRAIRWQKICKEAAEQSKRTYIPEISKVIDLDKLELTGTKLICSTTEKENTIKKQLKKLNHHDKINIVIGPEGGLSLKEENMLEAKSFIKVSLGSRILRAETVPLYVLSVINYEYMED